MKNLIWVGVTALLLASACDNEPGAGKTKVEASAAVEAVAPATTAAPVQSVNYVFSGGSSSFEFVGAKVTAKHEGKFKDFNGTIQLVGGDVTKSKVNVEVKVASLEAEPEKLQGHLLSPDLLDAQKFPTATFESTSVTAGGADGATHTVTGNLTLHGEKKSISFPATIKVEGDRATVAAEFVINRKDFGIVYPGMPDDLIKDDVLIKLNLNASKG
jgi:polyisoprenoid-binding protein YceI